MVEHDSKGHPYIDVGNIRVTFLPGSSWNETGHGLRIQAYRGGENRALHKGAELHLPSREDGFALIAAIATLLHDAS
jgi:hypothetical protein